MSFMIRWLLKELKGRCRVTRIQISGRERKARNERAWEWGIKLKWETLVAGYSFWVGFEGVLGLAWAGVKSSGFILVAVWILIELWMICWMNFRFRYQLRWCFRGIVVCGGRRGRDGGKEEASKKEGDGLQELYSVGVSFTLNGTNSGLGFGFLS